MKLRSWTPAKPHDIMKGQSEKPLTMRYIGEKLSRILLYVYVFKRIICHYLQLTKVIAQRKSFCMLPCFVCGSLCASEQIATDWVICNRHNFIWNMALEAENFKSMLLKSGEDSEVAASYEANWENGQG